MTSISSPVPMLYINWQRVFTGILFFREREVLLKILFAGSMSSNESTQTIPRVSINIHSSTTFHGFKRCEQAKRCRRKTKNNGRHLSPFQDCDDKIHILKILTKNDKNCVHLYPSIKSKKKCRKRRDKKISRPTFRVSIPILRINEEGKCKLPYK